MAAVILSIITLQIVWIFFARYKWKEHAKLRPPRLHKKTPWGFMLFVILPTPSWGVLMVNIHEETVSLGKVYIVEDCEWDDLYLKRTTITYRDTSIGPQVPYTVSYSTIVPSDYIDTVQECRSLFHSSLEEKKKAGCYVDIGNGYSFTSPGGPTYSSREWSETTEKIFSVHTNQCDDCDDKPTTVVPEPDSLSLSLLAVGLAFLAYGKCRKGE